jgi:two-component sensor histidine kinase
VALAPLTRRALAALCRQFLHGAPWFVATGGLLLICLLLGMTWSASTGILEDIVKFERFRLPKLQMLQAARAGDLDASIAIRNVLLARDADLDRQELARYAAAQRSAAAALDEFAAHTHRPEERDLFRRTLDARSSLVAVRENVIALDARGMATDADGLTRTLQSKLGDYIAQLDRLQAYQSGRVNALVDEMASRSGTVRLLLTVSALLAGVTLFVVAASWRAELKRQVRLRDEHIASLHAQRNALIGEVHHRIKNHLQGLLGLIETHKRAGNDPRMADKLTGLHGHVLALVGVHGLQAKDAGQRVTLQDLVRQQAEIVRAGFPDGRIDLSGDEALREVVLPQDSAVPVALIVTELVVNAIKHGDDSPVHISSGSDGTNDVFVSVRNGLSDAMRLDWAAGRGLGTGLRLVSTLSEGVARLVQHTGPDDVTMTLHVARPAAQG